MTTVPDSSDAPIVVAMSGGVDSSVVAALLRDEGRRVVGVTLRLYSPADVVPGRRTCCGGADIADARRVADHLGIAHYVLDFEDRFQQSVVVPFAESYARGETPVPCVLCNQTVKFRDLFEAARLLGAGALATGHYVRRLDGAAGPELHRGADPVRDQSYFLFATTRAQLDFLRFPLGALAKDETRAIARRLGLPVAAKRDSQDICFVPDGDYGRIVARMNPEAMAEGDIVHVDGRVLGRHGGIGRFTVGQRRGLGIGGAEPLFVVRLEPAARRVVVGPKPALACDRLRLKEVNWLGEGEGPPPRGLRVHVKMRSAQPPVPATVIGTGAGRAEVVLDDAFFGIAPGQACALYQGERMLGGGWIRREGS